MTFDRGEGPTAGWRGMVRVGGGPSRPARMGAVLLLIWIVIAVTVVFNVPPVLRDLVMLLAITALGGALAWGAARALAERNALAARIETLEAQLAAERRPDRKAAPESVPERAPEPVPDTAQPEGPGSPLDMIDTPLAAASDDRAPGTGAAPDAPREAAAPFPARPAAANRRKARVEPKAPAAQPKPASPPGKPPAQDPAAREPAPERDAPWPESPQADATASASADAAPDAPGAGESPTPPRSDDPEPAAAPPRTAPAPADPAPAPSLATEDYIRALDFPETADDTEGFRALRLALRDPQAAPLVRAGQDVLTLLSEDGIYMEDLARDYARPQLWRSFAEGARGGAVSGLGGISDRDTLARVRERMRSDAVFRDVAHHFLRQFERGLAGVARHAGDDDLARIGETRSARAFVLLGQVTGMFD